MAESRLERDAPDAEDYAGRGHQHGGPGDEIQQGRPPCALTKEEEVVKYVAGNCQDAAAPVRLLNDVVAFFGYVILGARRIVHRNAVQRKIPGQRRNSRELIGAVE